MTGGARLRQLLARPEPLVLPGVADALTARIAVEAGFEAVYATGAGITNAQLGLPDLGLLSFTEMLEQTARMTAAVDVPVIADIDTGYGNALNVHRAVAAFARAGVAGVQLEDQVSPKRCGHFDGTEVVPVEEMLEKLAAAEEARPDLSLVVVARTDALATEGLEGAVARGIAYARAGADLVFVEAPRTSEVLVELPRRIPAPLVVNMVEGGRTPLLGATELGALGYRVVLWANTALRAAAFGAREALQALRRDGSSAAVAERLLGWDDRQRLVGLPEQTALARRYATTPASTVQRPAEAAAPTAAAMPPEEVPSR